MTLRDICQDCGTPRAQESDSRVCPKCGADLQLDDSVEQSSDSESAIDAERDGNVRSGVKAEDNKAYPRSIVVIVCVSVIILVGLVVLLVIQIPKCISNSISSSSSAGGGGVGASDERSVDVRVGVSSASAASRAMELYRERVDELAGMCGMPAIEKGEDGVYVVGVPIAILADFGAQRDSLLVAYREPDDVNSTTSSSTEIAYQIELWDAGFDANKLELVFADEIRLSDSQNGDGLQIAMLGEGKMALIENSSEDASATGVELIGFVNGGEVGELERIGWGTYRFDGQKVQWDSYRDAKEYLPLASPDETGYSLQLGLGQSINDLDSFGITKLNVEVAPLGLGAGRYLATTNYESRPIRPPASAQIVSAAFDGDQFLVTGTFAYQDADHVNPADWNDSELLGPTQWTFNLNDGTRFYLVGGINGPRQVDRERFTEVLTISQMGLIIEVEGGFATSISMSS